jgi:hypothetical protein
MRQGSQGSLVPLVGFLKLVVRFAAGLVVTPGGLRARRVNSEGSVMVKRINTYNYRKRELPKMRAELDAFLKRAKTTREGLMYWVQQVDQVEELEQWLSEFTEKQIKWGDEWAQDDWPHASRREHPRSGCLIAAAA